MSLKPRIRHRPRLSVHLGIEALESRDLPAITAWPGLVQPLAEAEPNDTLDYSQDLGGLTGGSLTGVAGVISARPDGGDVDWYRFSLDRPAAINLALLPPEEGGEAVGVLTLYNSDPEYFNDPFSALGHRLLAQAEGAAQPGGVWISRPLAAGTYYVAVSGAGNRHFHPFLAGSGYAGGTGPYGLLIATTDLAPSSGPVVLAGDPAAGATVLHSPLMIRVSFSEAIDPSTVFLDDNVRLTFSPDSTFGDDNDYPISLLDAGLNLSTAARELQLAPARALPPGYYRLFLRGNGAGELPALADFDGDSLGEDADHETGQDYVLSFKVTGSEGIAGDDTAATAHTLGDITHSGLVQTVGLIGDDPAYDPGSEDPRLSNRAADVDLYHFRLSGPGRYAFTAEIFAGRIGSRLDPGVSLFRWDASDGRLHLVAANDSTLNGTPSTNGLVPLLDDAVLYAGLTAGDYYLAVSAGPNTPEAALGRAPGVGDVFDPNDPHSGAIGWVLGHYVLNLAVRPDNEPPQVVAVSLEQGAVLTTPLTRFTVQFSEPVNLQQLAYQAFQQTASGQVASVYIEDASGRRYLPRMEAYDPAANQAQFLMLDRLPNGAHTLHLSGALGLTDLADNPLRGDGPAGDYVVRFTVQDPTRETADTATLWSDREPNSDPTAPQVLGLLFPRELEATVMLTGTISPAAGGGGDRADYYQFEVLQHQNYIFVLKGDDLPAGVRLTLLDSQGNPVPASTRESGDDLRTQLDPGIYVIGIVSESSDSASFSLGESSGEEGTREAAYQLSLALGGAGDNAPPLTSGPAPAIQLRLANAPLPETPPPVPRVVLPPQAEGAASDTVVFAAGLGTTNPGPRLAAAPGVPLVSLLVLGDRPLGGVGDSLSLPVSSARPVLTLQMSSPSLLANLLQLAILTDLGDYGGSETNDLPGEAEGQPSYSDLTRHIVECLQHLTRSLQYAVDAALSSDGWWNYLLVVPEPPASPPLLPEGTHDSEAEHEAGGPLSDSSSESALPQASSVGKPEAEGEDQGSEVGGQPPRDEEAGPAPQDEASPAESCLLTPDAGSPTPALWGWELALIALALGGVWALQRPPAAEPARVRAP